MSARPVTLLVVVLAVILTSVGIIYAKHESRKLFVELQGLAYQKDDMDVEWGQLQLEQSTLTTQGQVEHAARTRLGMMVPAAEQMVIVKP